MVGRTRLRNTPVVVLAVTPLEQRKARAAELVRMIEMRRIGEGDDSMSPHHQLQGNGRRINVGCTSSSGRYLRYQALLDIRSKRLKLAEAFLSEVDTPSTTDVVHWVNALNEIFQAASLLGEMLQITGRTDRTWMLGEQMASILATESMNVCTDLDLNPLLVQIVLQIAITTWCRFVVSCDTAMANFLPSIYSEIRQVEDQAVCGPWHSITRAQLRPSSDGWTENLLNGLLSILIMAGWSPANRVNNTNSKGAFHPSSKLRKAYTKLLYMEDGCVPASSKSGNKILEKGCWNDGVGTEMTLFPKVSLEGTLKEATDSVPAPASRLKKLKRHGDGLGHGLGEEASATSSDTSVCDKELKGLLVKRGWETSDALSAADAIQKVDVLNMEITQISDRARVLLGDNMVAVLAAGLLERASIEPVLVQVEIVVLPTFWLNKKLVVPPMYRHPPSNKNVWKVQPSRSVARAQQEFSSSNWSQDLLDGLLDILALAGWSAPSANQKCLFEEQFPPLFNATGGVCKTLSHPLIWKWLLLAPERSSRLHP
ncbi:hypothetical protein K443DRAFT_5375 [Laccaria amethystina LaAM-08-1]|uniref:Uncharacterized protein n=1 Tax=Laccaria amethystina LaAM-08-1 TaxID=1095629 RepID=A0A0C9XEV7_9AGAR|nr:hypothetical protein K443DRAFT_5375 [Laccaria amethystina LaAM-08-1]